MKIIILTICFLLLSIGINPISSWFWRRRRRRRRSPPPSPPPCNPVNCQVGSWSIWSSCSHHCGTSGTQTRTRRKTSSEECGGQCPYSLKETQACNRGNCQNGGTPNSGGCSCRLGYGGTCCEKDDNECINSPCQHECTNTYGSYTCKCYSCYTKLGTQCDLRQCKINNHCHVYGTVNPSNQCQDCNDSDKFAWTNNNTLPCTDGKACTKNDRCSNGVCSGTPFSCLPCEECQNDVCRVKPGFCVINESGIRQCFNHGSLRPGHQCQDCNDSDKFAWTNNNTLPCSDGKGCTKNDRCSNGVCSGTPFSCLPCEECQNDVCRVKPGYCVINESGIRQCFNHGSLRPGHQCQDCNDSDKFAWTNNNTLPCTDGKVCTKNDRCSNGVCSGTPFSCLPCEECQNDVCRVKPGYCVINESGIRQCFNHGSLRPGHQCQDCNDSDKFAWTNNNTLPCTDGKACTKNDRCSNGVCSGTPFSCLPCEECQNDVCHVKPGYCVINESGIRQCFNHGSLRPGHQCQQEGKRKCYATNHYKPGNPCQRCDISKNVSTWSDNDGIACNDGDRCTRNDNCSNGLNLLLPKLLISY